jgi:cytoskeletal protein CcmA (bactofilin family)
MNSNLTGLNNVDLNQLTSSKAIFFTSSKDTSTEGPKLYKIDYAKIRDDQGNLIPESGSLQITASGLKVEGDIDGDGNITLDGTLSFNGFNFVESSVSVTSGSTQFGSGSTGADIPLTTHQFTGSVLITGSNLALDGDGVNGGVLSIPGYANVAATLGTFLTIDEGGQGAGTGISTTTFRAFSQSISSSLDSLNDLVIGVGPNSSSLMNFSQSISSSFDLLNNLVIGAGPNSSSLMNFSSSVTASLDLISSSLFTSTSGLLHFTGSAITIFNTIAIVTSSLHTFTSSVSTSLGALDTFTSSLVNAVSFSGTNTFAQGNLNVAGNLTVQGTTTTFNVQDLSIEDRFIVIGSGSSQVDNNIDVGIIFETGSFDGVDTTARGMALYFDNSRNRLAVGKHINNVDFTASFDGGFGAQEANNVGQKGIRAGNMVTAKSTNIQGKNLSTDIGNDINSASFGTGEIVIDINEDIWFYVGADHNDEFPPSD